MAAMCLHRCDWGRCRGAQSPRLLPFVARSVTHPSPPPASAGLVAQFQPVTGTQDWLLNSARLPIYRLNPAPSYPRSSLDLQHGVQHAIPRSALLLPLPAYTLPLLQTHHLCAAMFAGDQVALSGSCDNLTRVMLVSAGTKSPSPQRLPPRRPPSHPQQPTSTFHPTAPLTPGLQDEADQHRPRPAPGRDGGPRGNRLRDVCAAPPPPALAASAAAGRARL
jgi:hypothetical protein